MLERSDRDSAPQELDPHGAGELADALAGGLLGAAVGAVVFALQIGVLVFAAAHWRSAGLGAALLRIGVAVVVINALAMRALLVLSSAGSALQARAPRWVPR